MPKNQKKPAAVVRNVNGSKPVRADKAGTGKKKPAAMRATKTADESKGTETPVVVGEPNPVKQEPETVADIVKDVDQSAKLPEPTRRKGKKASPAPDLSKVVGSIPAAVADVVVGTGDATAEAQAAPEKPADTPAKGEATPAPVVTLAGLEAELDAGYKKMDELLAEYEKVTKSVLRLELQIEALSTAPITK